MVSRLSARRPWLRAAVVAAALLVTIPAFAQISGMIKGVVRDDKGQPVEGAAITIDLGGNVTRHFETKTNKNGEFVQIGLQSGFYRVTAEKVKVGGAFADVTIKAGSTAEANMTLKLGVGVAATKEAKARNAELKKVFEEGVAASRGGDLDTALAKFKQGATIDEGCYDCYYNIGFACSQKKDYDQAEVAFKKALELKPDMVDAYNGLANIYNAQRKFDQAAEMSKKAAEVGAGAAKGAAGGGNADAMYNQGVILWNAGKVADAKKEFEAAVAANPAHAESHYQLGMVAVNEGNLAKAAEEFDTYLKLAPSGPNAAQAKALVAQLKK
jgi:tetratricopeptide (TPR) repeat protein